MRKSLKKTGHMCKYDQITALYAWSEHNMGNQLYSKKIF